MKNNSEKISKKDWRVLLIGALISAVLSSPSWLPVFGIDYEWFGSLLVTTIQRLLPLMMLAAGFVIGRNSRRRQMTNDNITAERIAEFKKSIADLQSENEELAARVSWFEDDLRRKLDGFTDPELKAMIECYRAGIGHMDASWTSAPIEPTGGLARSRTDEVMGQLIARGVVTFRNSRRFDCYDYALSPEWRSFVADNVDSIEARLRANEKRPSEVLKDLTDRYLESYAE